MAQRRDELPPRLVCVTFAPPAMLGLFERGLELPFLFLGDPERALYRAFGFQRGSVARVWLDPRVWLRYAQLIAQGQRPGGPEQDTLQLGGDAVLDADGRLRWIYRSAGPEDRPSVDEIRAGAGL